MDILGGDDDSDLKLTINENYANRYDRWRRGEELQKLKDKYGDNVDSEESSTSEEEDEDAKELTEEIERDFFKTLACLKEKNPKIYDKNVRFFESKSNEEVKEKGKKRKAESSMSLGEYQRKMLLENQGRFSEDEDEKKCFQGVTDPEMEKSLKESFNDVLKDSDNESDNENWGKLFKKRVKTEKELKVEEEDYKLWLSGEKERLKDKKKEKELKGLRDYWADPKLDDNEKFLKDYILNKRFLEKDKKSRTPAYDEIIHDSDSGLSADENTLEIQEEFERKYNFRFEEPDQEFLKSYPRTIDSSMRKKDDRRKRHRAEVKARKEQEKVKKAEELKRLKSLKRKEIMERIKKLQRITGNEDIAFENNDLEDDFDPEEHDKRMKELFNDDYYGTCKDEEKPEDPELNKELEIENWDEWGEGEETEELHCEDPGFNMDCDYDPRQDKKFQKDLIESTRKRKKRRQSKFAAAVAKEKPVFDPRDKTFEKYVDEYYSLDYEDLIGDLPCRFKYRKTIPNDFGLSVEEILAAPDKELNQWVSVKKIMQRRPDHAEIYDVQAYKKKSKNFDMKKKCLPSLYNPQNENADDELPSTINGEKSKKKVVLPMQNNDQTLVKKKNKLNNEEIDSSECQSTFLQKVRDKKYLEDFYQKQYLEQYTKVFDMKDKRIKAYGINPNKLKKKLKKKMKYKKF